MKHRRQKTAKYDLGLKCIFLILFATAWPSDIQSQTQSLHLDTAYVLLEQRYPLLKDEAIYHQIHTREQKIITNSQLPTISLKADGRLQSDVPSLDIPEGINFPLEIDLPLYAAKSFLEINYNILDGGIRNAQKEINHLEHGVLIQKTEVDKFALRERINEHFVRIILLREENNIMGILIDDIHNKVNTITAAVDEGGRLESELLKIKVKELELIAQQDNTLLQLNGVINSLANLINTELSTDVKLIFPSFNFLDKFPNINRPEQKQILLQQKALLANTKLIDAKQKPKLGVFAQAGVGYPNPLNIFDSEFSPYGLLGFQFNWPITDWKKSKLKKELLTLQSERLNNAKETLEFNIESKETQFLTEESRLLNLMSKDLEIINLQSKITQQLSAQMDEGVITTAEYVTQINTELQAKQKLVLHQAQLLKLRLVFWNERGGQS